MENSAIVYHKNDRLLTTSLNVAKVFQKEHFHVIRDIENLDCSREFTASNFGLSEYEDSTGRKLPMYIITRDGWSFLVMGYRGKKAAKFKEDYIAAFNNMERTLTCPKLKVLFSPQAIIHLEKTSIELLKDFVELYTKPLEKHEPAISIDHLHQAFNGWLSYNRYHRVSKNEFRQYMSILGHKEAKINYFMSYVLSFKKEFR